MSEPLQPVLDTLRDVHGVLGSFVLGSDGSVRASDLPATIDAQALVELGPRVLRLHEAWSSFDQDMESAVLVFGPNKLHLRAYESGFVGVLSEQHVNMPALKMAITMVLRRVASEPEPRRSVPPPLPPGISGPQAQAESSSPGSQASPSTPPPPEGTPAPRKSRLFGLRG